MTPYANRWADYGLSDMSCTNAEEYCHSCGRLMVESIEPTGTRSRKTGESEFARWHSCPTWVDRSFLHRLRSMGCPGWGHASHDADNPMLCRTYR